MIAVSKVIGKGLATQVTRASDLKQQQLQPFRQAVDVFTARRQWPTSHEETIMEGRYAGRPARVYLRNVGGVVALYLVRWGEKSNYSSDGFRIGLLTADGWTLSQQATDEAYLAWRSKIGKDIWGGR